MEQSSSSKTNVASSRVGKKYLVKKVNKCIQVDMDLEEASLSAEKSSPDIVCSPEVTASSQVWPPRTSENLQSSFQILTTPALPRKCLSSSAPLMPYTENFIPPPPPLMPGMGAAYPCSQLPPSNGEGLICGSCRTFCPKMDKQPTLRMKPFNWQMLPLDVAKDGHSLWCSVATASNATIDLDYTSIEQLFCVPQTRQQKKAEVILKKQKEISFVDPMRSLHLNIVLKQFKCSSEEIADMIQKGDGTRFDAEALKHLMKLLPKNHEIESLKKFRGQKAKLANADQFYLCLLEVPSYHLRIECMLICAEVSVMLDLLWPKAKLIRAACETLLTNQRLPVFCHLILKVGNFLNYGRHTGNAGGFKISTLLVLTEMRANQSCTTLLHHIVGEVEKKYRDLLYLPNDLEPVSKATGISLQDMQGEVNALLNQVLVIECKISSSKDDLNVQFGKYIKDSLNGLKELDEEVKSLLEKKTELADYLCEDKNTSLDDVFNTIKTFRELFSKALKENQDRTEQGAKAEKRKRLCDKEEAKHLKHH